MSEELDFLKKKLIQMNLNASTSNSANPNYHAQLLPNAFSTHYVEAFIHLVNGALKMVIRFLNNGSYEIVF